MAKKKSQSRAEAVRSAVDQAFQSQIPRERISELLDELGSTAGRLRGAVDDLRPASAEEVKVLRADLQALAARVDALEAAAAKPKPAPRRAAAKPASKSTGAAKPKASGGAAKTKAASTAKPRRAPAKPKPPAAGS